MKTINRCALVALAFGFLTLGAGQSFAQSSTQSDACCAAQICCGSECSKSQAHNPPANAQLRQWYKAKYGRELPGQHPETTRPLPPIAVNTAADQHNESWRGANPASKIAPLKGSNVHVSLDSNT